LRKNSYFSESKNTSPVKYRANPKLADNAILTGFKENNPRIPGKVQRR
jgi:hypothetical protein